MYNYRNLSYPAAALLLTALSATAFATNGYFTHGTGARAKGQAGAGLASPHDAISVAANPASALATAGRFDFGLSLFNPRRSYNASASQANGNGGAFTIGPNAIDSEREFFLIPHIAWNIALDDDSALGLAFYGRGGMNTRWQGGSATFDPDGPGPAPVSEQSGTFGAGTAGVNLAQAFFDLAYARRVSDRITLGGALVVGVQAFEADGVAPFAGFTESFAASGGQTPPSRLSNNGHDYSWGAGLKVGFQAVAGRGLQLAGSFQTKIRMSEFDDYADLFAEQGDFDIPASALLGATLRVTNALRLSLDLERTFYSDVASVGNALGNVFACPTAGAGGASLSACLGGSNGAGFGWRDMTTVKLGAEWDINGSWTVRGGISDGDQPIPESEVLFNILAPGVIEQHITAGFTRRSSNGGEWTLAVMYALNNEVSGVNAFDPTQTISLEMDQWEAELGYSWRF